MNSSTTRPGNAAPVYSSSFHALLRVLEGNGHGPEDVLMVTADPAEVPAGAPVWTASFRTWAWLKIEDAPMGPPYDAAEVVLGDGWCVANSAWDAEDWVFAPASSTLVTRARASGCDLLDMLTRQDPVQAVDAAISLDASKPEPAAEDDGVEDDEWLAAPDSEPEREPTPGPTPEMLRAFRAGLRARLRASRFGAIIEYPTRVALKCPRCKEGRARLHCRKCNGRGKIVKERCGYCGGHGEHYVCLNPECSGYRETWAEEHAEEERIQGAILAAEHNVELLTRARAEGQTVRFHYRAPNGTEGMWEVEPYHWELETRSGKPVHGVQPGRLYVHASYRQPGFKVRSFAVDRISDLSLLGSVPARGKIVPPTVLEGFAAGDAVAHPVFGLGNVLALSGTSEKPRVVVEFTDHGTKTLDLKLAKLRKLEPGERLADAAATRPSTN